MSLVLQRAQGRIVQATPELYRVLSLPSRTWTDDQAEQCAAWLTSQLRTPVGQQSLRPIQAIALWELYQTRGLFGIIRVGAGKTHVSFLAPHMVNSVRPLLIVKASLQKKARAEMMQLSRDWYIPRHIRIVSYELLGQRQSARLLEEYQPDLIITDECHKIRNPRAAVTRRVARYMQARPETVFVAMSGTITKRSLKDYARMLRWCLGKMNAPIPQQENELEEWADALDEKRDPFKRMGVGALSMLADGATALTDVRRGYHARLISCAGVIATKETPIDCSLTIQAVEPELGEAVDAAVYQLRDTWSTPDGWTFADAVEMWRHVRELSLGFYYRWNPRPPDEWLEPRKAWHSKCRSIIANGRTYDSEGQVANAIRWSEFSCPEYWAWQNVKKTFIPNTECVWIDYGAIQYAMSWAQRPGIVWCEHVKFAELLAQLTGLPYYGGGGRDERTGVQIEQANPRKACIASIEANFEGRNLQMFARNLITSPPANGPRWEQLIARTHREGQLADEVHVDVIMSCIEHYGAFEQAQRDAQYARDTQGQLQKILYADKLFPDTSDVMLRSGPRWQQ